MNRYLVCRSAPSFGADFSKITSGRSRVGFSRPNLLIRSFLPAFLYWFSPSLILPIGVVTRLSLPNSFSQFSSVCSRIRSCSALSAICLRRETASSLVIRDFTLRGSTPFAKSLNTRLRISSKVIFLMSSGFHFVNVSRVQYQNFFNQFFNRLMIVSSLAVSNGFSLMASFAICSKMAAPSSPVKRAKASSQISSSLRCL